MISRGNLTTTHALGTYSELVVAAAFIAEGCEVAFPMGNNRSWDLLVNSPQNPTQWSRVQVKTIAEQKGMRYPTLRVMRGMARAHYTKEELDILVAIHPESGSLWRFAAEQFDRKSEFRLDEKYIWRGSIQSTALPLNGEPGPFHVRRRMSLAEERKHVREKLPETRPEWVSEGTWYAAVRWCDGHGYGAIAKEVGISEAGARERVVRALHRLGLIDFPASLRNKHKRKKPSVTEPG